MEIIDRTAETAGTTRTRNDPPKQIYSRHDRQSLDQVRGAFLHQTYFFNPNPSRYDHTIAHFVILRRGDVLQVRPLTAGLNSVSNGRAVDIEFEGRYPSLRQIRHLRRTDAPVPHPTLPQLLAGRALLRHLRDTQGIAHVWGHRQASRMERDNCPGPQLWYNVGEWAVRNLGLTSTGLRESIPVAWRTERSLELVWPSPLDDPWDDARFDTMISRVNRW